MEKSTKSGDIARTAARIIASARGSYNNADAFDYMIKVEGIKPFGELYNECYRIANEHQATVAPGDTQDDLDDRKRRAGELWAQVLPELENYAAECKAARFTGWSRMSDGPIRRVRHTEPAEER